MNKKDEVQKVLKEKLHSHENNSYKFFWIFQFTLARGLYKRHNMHC